MKRKRHIHEVYLTVGSQPQAVMLPLLQAAVTAYVTPAELIAYVKAASLLPEIDQRENFLLDLASELVCPVCWTGVQRDFQVNVKGARARSTGQSLRES